MKITRMMITMCQPDINGDYLAWMNEVVDQELTTDNVNVRAYIWLCSFFPMDHDYKLLDWCAMRDPSAALEHANHLITTDRFNQCVKDAPWAAIQHAAWWLTKEKLAWCAAHV